LYSDIEFHALKIHAVEKRGHGNKGEKIKEQPEYFFQTSIFQENHTQDKKDELGDQENTDYRPDCIFFGGDETGRKNNKSKRNEIDANNVNKIFLIDGKVCYIIHFLLCRGFFIFINKKMLSQRSLRERDKNLKAKQDRMVIQETRLKAKKSSLAEQEKVIIQWNQYIQKKEAELAWREQAVQQKEATLVEFQSLATQWQEHITVLQKEAQKINRQTRGPLFPPGTPEDVRKKAMIRFYQQQLKKLGAVST